MEKRELLAYSGQFRDVALFAEDTIDLKADVVVEAASTELRTVAMSLLIPRGMETPKN